MNKKEALIAMINGEKIKENDGYIYFDPLNCLFKYHFLENKDVQLPDRAVSLGIKNDYEIYEQIITLKKSQLKQSFFEIYNENVLNRNFDFNRLCKKLGFLEE